MDNVVDSAAVDIKPVPEVVLAQPNERLFKQSELNEIVGRAKHEAVESFKRQGVQSVPQNHDVPSAVSKGLSEADVRRLSGEELQKRREEWHTEMAQQHYASEAKRVVDTYRNKINAGKEKYQDFDTVVNEDKLGKHYWNLIPLVADHVDNAADVIYELSRNKLKMHQLHSMYENNNAEDAIHEVLRLSESLKANEQAAAGKQANAPLSQQRPSNTGTDSGATLSLRDLKMKYRV